MRVRQEDIRERARIEEQLIIQEIEEGHELLKQDTLSVSKDHVHNQLENLETRLKVYQNITQDEFKLDATTDDQHQIHSNIEKDDKNLTEEQLLQDFELAKEEGRVLVSMDETDDFFKDWGAFNDSKRIHLELKDASLCTHNVTFDSWEEQVSNCMRLAHMSGNELDEQATPKETVLAFYREQFQVEIKRDDTLDSGEIVRTEKAPTWQDDAWIADPAEGTIEPPVAVLDTPSAKQELEQRQHQVLHPRVEKNSPSLPPSQTSASTVLGGGVSLLAQKIGAGAAAVLGVGHACLVGLAQGARQALTERQAATQNECLQRSSIVPSRDEFEQAFSMEKQQRFYRWQRAEEHCAKLEERMLHAERLCDGLAENPIVKGYVERMGSQIDPVAMTAYDFHKALDDPMNPYGAKAKDDMSQLFACLQDIQRDLPVTANACAKVQATERLEERTSAFLADMARRPEAALLKDSEEISLKDKAHQLVESLRTTLEKVRDSLRNFFKRELPHDENDSGPVPA